MSRQALSTASLTAAALVLAAGVSPAGAQEDAALDDGRWLPYLGCWVDVEAAGPMTCVVPEGAGVALLTVTGADVTDRRVLRGDGVERPVETAGCTGTEAAEFSADDLRVFTRAATACGGGERSSRGLMAMVEPDEWIEVRTVGVDDGSVAWVKRYRPAPAARVEAAGLVDRLDAGVSRRVLEAARIAAASVASVDDIIEAHERTDAAAVTAWIAEDGDPIRLDADRLVRLADAGVPAEVIDVAVAVSFPDRFAVAREPRNPRDRGYGDSFHPFGPWGSWGLWGPFSLRYGYGGYYGYRGYYGQGYYGPGYIGYRPTVVVVAPVTSSGGRVVRGRGYTRGSQGSGATAVPSVRTGAPSASRVGTGYRGSSGSSSKGKAKPRGG